MIKNKYFAIDFIKPIILYHYGGFYVDIDFNYKHSLGFVHTVFDLYTGSETPYCPGVAAGVVAARKHH